MHIRSFLVAIFGCLLVACGGGGGGGGNGNVPPPSTSDGGSFTLGSNTATFNARTDDPRSLQSSIPLHVTDTRNVAAIGAAYVAPNQPASWLSVGITGSGADYSVNLDVPWVGMIPGTYTAVVSIGTATASGTVLQRRDLTVTLTITEITVRAEAGPFGATATFGHSDLLHPQMVHVDAPDGRTWTVTSTVPWIHTPGGTFTGAADVEVVIDSTGLAIDQYNGQLRFVSQADADDNTIRSVTLHVLAPALDLSSDQLTLGGEDGNGSRQVSVLASLATGTNSYPVSITTATTSGGDWLSAGSPSVNIGSGGITLSLAAEAATATPGRYEGAVHVEANVLGQVFSRTLDVHFNQDQNHLVAATLGVAFSKLPSRSVLERSVRISDSLGRNGIAWTAVDDASWLTVTAAGTTGGEVELVADPTGLPADQIHYATVTVASPSAFIDNEQHIRVALKVGSTDPVVTSVAQTAVSIVANPVEPWVYASLTGGAIEVRDVHSGALLDTFDAVSGPDGGGLEISDDGLTLFAIDGWNTQRVRVLDARTGAVLGEMPLARANTTTLHYMRPGGHPVLISGGGQAFDVATRTELVNDIALSAYYPTNGYAHTSDHRVLYSQERGISPPRLEKGRIAFSALVTPQLVTEYLLSSEYGEAGGSVCVSPDDSRVMTAVGSFSAPFTLLDASDLSVVTPLPAQTYAASNVACLWNGLYLGSTSRDPPVNLFFYDAQGNGIASSLLYQVDHEPMLDRVIVSGDASRVIAVTGGPSFHTSFYDAPAVP